MENKHNYVTEENKGGLKPEIVSQTASMNRNTNSVRCYCLNCLKLLVHSLRPETSSNSSFSWVCPHYQKIMPWGDGAGSRSSGILSHSARCILSQLGHVMLHSFIRRSTRQRITWQEWRARWRAAPCLSFNRSCSWGPKALGLLILCILLMQSRETRVQKSVHL